MGGFERDFPRERTRKWEASLATDAEMKDGGERKVEEARSEAVPESREDGEFIKAV